MVSWNSTPKDTVGRVVFKVPLSGNRYFGLVLSEDWSSFFLGTFQLLD